MATPTTEHPVHGSSAEVSHSHGSARPSYDDINTPVVILIGVISAIVTLLTIWGVEGIYYHWNSSWVREHSYDVTNPRQADLINAQKEQLMSGDPEKQYHAFDSIVGDVISKYRTEPSGSEQAPAGDNSASGGSPPAAGDDH